MDYHKLQKQLGGLPRQFVLHYFECIESTNKKAVAMVREGYDQESIVLAEKQTGGKGRMGRAWESDNNRGIWASFIFIQNSDPVLYVRALSVALSMTLTDMQIGNSEIKWPNDLLINGKKVAGVLAETVSGPSGKDTLVLGFGLNVNQDASDFSEDVRHIATSLRLVTGDRYAREDILEKIMENLIAVLGLPGPEAFTRYKNRLAALGRTVLIDGKKVFAEAICDDGGMLIVTENGTHKTIYSGTLTYGLDN
jgi:BirA family biotin operon repressor/biotin-[acetyl-CoA-carboxylase] ligase